MDAGVRVAAPAATLRLQDDAGESYAISGALATLLGGARDVLSEERVDLYSERTVWLRQISPGAEVCAAAT